MRPPAEIVTVTSVNLACDGGEGALGHPRVYLTMKSDHVDCPYCGKRYVLAEGANHAAASH